MAGLWQRLARWPLWRPPIKTPLDFIARHAAGDWGELDEQDRRENEQSLIDDCRLLSAYRLNDGTKIWIITEANRSSTTILLPEEY